MSPAVGRSQMPAGDKPPPYDLDRLRAALADIKRRLTDVAADKPRPYSARDNLDPGNELSRVNKWDGESRRIPMTSPLRILIAKPGLDSHDRGAKIIARALREAGMEVIYTGIRRTPEEIVRAAIEEDVDLIGLSILAGAQLHLTARVLELLQKHGADDIGVVLGGPIPPRDADQLRQMGVAEVFTPGMRVKEIVSRIRELVDQQGPARQAGRKP